MLLSGPFDVPRLGPTAAGNNDHSGLHLRALGASLRVKVVHALWLPNCTHPACKSFKMFAITAFFVPQLAFGCGRLQSRSLVSLSSSAVTLKATRLIAQSDTETSCISGGSYRMRIANLSNAISATHLAKHLLTNPDYGLLIAIGLSLRLSLTNAKRRRPIVNVAFTIGLRRFAINFSGSLPDYIQAHRTCRSANRLCRRLNRCRIHVRHLLLGDLHDLLLGHLADLVLVGRA